MRDLRARTYSPVLFLSRNNNRTRSLAPLSTAAAARHPLCASVNVCDHEEFLLTFQRQWANRYFLFSFSLELRTIALTSFSRTVRVRFRNSFVFSSFRRFPRESFDQWNCLPFGKVRNSIKFLIITIINSKGKEKETFDVSSWRATYRARIHLTHSVGKRKEQKVCMPGHGRGHGHTLWHYFILFLFFCFSRRLSGVSHDGSKC